MIEEYLHTNQSSAPESPLEHLLCGFYGITQQQEKEKHYWQQRCEQFEAQQQSLPETPIVADGKQKEVIAIFNVIYKAGYIVGISQKEFMERIANALGCPGIANYAPALYNIKTTYKYDEIFDNLNEVAKKEKIG
jgi:hypothetical protein